MGTCPPCQGAARVDLFPLGQTVMTPGISELMRNPQFAHCAVEAIRRHHAGDWGDVDAEDKRSNDIAVMRGERLLSAYTCDRTKIWIITEADRRATTLLLPNEY